MQNNTPRNKPNLIFNSLQNDLAQIAIKKTAAARPIFSNSIAKNLTHQWTPSIDVCEIKDYFIIQADLPGVKENDVKTEIKQGVLTLTGQRTTKITAIENIYSRIERIPGSFIRNINLPDTANPNDMKIESENGVLTITVGKKNPTKKRKNVSTPRVKKNVYTNISKLSERRLPPCFWGF